MRNECKKLLELYAETQLECVKNKKAITTVIITKCKKCKQDVFIATNITENIVWMGGYLCKND